MLRSHALTLAALGSDVNEFLSSKIPAMQRIRAEILDGLREVGKTYVIGGLVRDLAIHGLEDRPISDLDIVVRCRPADLGRFAAQMGATPNRFGGFGVRTDAYKVDFWSLQNTWAKTAGYVPIRQPADLTRSTFFDWDAVVYGLEERRVWALARYLDKLNSGVLGINLKPNPSPLGSLVRALRRLMIWDARPSFELRTFIENEITIHPWNEVIAAEQEAFHAQYLHEFVSASDYLLAVLAESKFKNLGSHKKRQMLFTKVDLPEAAYVKRIPRDLRFSAVRLRKRAKRVKPAAKDLFD